MDILAVPTFPYNDVDPENDATGGSLNVFLMVQGRDHCGFFNAGCVLEAGQGERHDNGIYRCTLTR